jgi:hypothetical protein
MRARFLATCPFFLEILAAMSPKMRAVPYESRSGSQRANADTPTYR